MKIIAKHSFAFLIALFSLSQSNAQDFEVWKTMIAEEFRNGNCVYNSRPLSSSDSIRIDWNSIPSKIENTKVTYISLASNSQYEQYKLKGRVFGVGGEQDGKEVLIIDENINLRFDDDVIEFLPKLKKVDDIPYNELYQYPTLVDPTYPITYEFISKDKIQSKSSFLGFTVQSKFDEEKDQLYSLDKYKLCYHGKLVLKDTLSGIPYQLSCFDMLPWVSSVRFQLTVNGKTTNVGLKLQVTVGQNDEAYMIDSIDFGQQKILITKSNKVKILNLSSASLFDNSVATTQGFSNNYRIVHVWGSWCGPCIKNMPKLVAFNAENPDIELIGICVDDHKDQAINQAKKSEIIWTNLHFTMAYFEKHNVLKATQYPTYFVVNKNNEIIGNFASFENAKELVLKR